MSRYKYEQSVLHRSGPKIAFSDSPEVAGTGPKPAMVGAAAARRYDAPKIADSADSSTTNSTTNLEVL